MRPAGKWEGVPCFTCDQCTIAAFRDKLAKLHEQKEPIALNYQLLLRLKLAEAEVVQLRQKIKELTL
jgi:hypothetical protein